MISDERAENACEFIRDNAKRHGQLKALVNFTDYKIKRARALAFKGANGTVAEREAEAWLAADVELAATEKRDAEQEEQELRDLIEAANLTFECWRTQQANQRKGM